MKFVENVRNWFGGGELFLGNQLNSQPRTHKICDIRILDLVDQILSKFLRMVQEERLAEVLRMFFKILVVRANFGDFGDFDIDFKILKKSCHVCDPILGQILENFDFRILALSQSYNKPPLAEFWFFVKFWWNWKIWNLMKLAILVNFEIWILTKFGNLASFTKIWSSIWIDLNLSFPTTPKLWNLDKIWSTKSKIWKFLYHKFCGF